VFDQQDPFARSQVPGSAPGTASFVTSNTPHGLRSLPIPAVSTWWVPGEQNPAVRRSAEDAVAQEWHVGDRILGLYEVIQLFEGGMGKVYHVYHHGWNADLAVKSPKRETFIRPDGRENFVREAETWINLGLHPHIVSCYYVRTLGGIPRIFAEYVAGGSLADWVRERRLYAGGHRQALEHILDVAIQFAWGLDYAHQQGLVHQDVKPANVLLVPDGTAKVTDFGLAKARALAGEEEGAGAGKSILVSYGGMTPAYCSPEQAARQPLSRKTDIWSWAVSILELFEGKVTWMIGALAAEALKSYLEDGADDASIPPMPSSLVTLLQRCLQKQPDDRPTSMAEIAATLLAIYQREIGHLYPRPAPRAAAALADTLNNRALSLVDLGKLEEAKQLWAQALQYDPQHLETTFNQAVVRWRGGEVTEDELLRQLRLFRESTQMRRGQAAYLLAQIHLERGDVEAALSLLDPGEREAQRLLEQIQFGASIAGRRLHTLSEYIRHTTVSLSADGRLALSGNADKTMRLWEVATGRCLRTFQDKDVIHAASLSADGRLAASCSAGSSTRWWQKKTIRLWETASGRCLHILNGHAGFVNAVSLSADGHLALSGDTEGTLWLWEVATGRCLRMFEGYSGSVNTVTLSCDARLALSGSVDGMVRLWEVATGRCLRMFEGHTGGVNGVSLSADARLALSGSADGTMRLWEVATGRCLRIFQRSPWVTPSSLSADGRLALACGSDGTVRLWEMATGRCLRIFPQETSQKESYSWPVTSVSLSADGRLAAWCGMNLQFWELPRDAPGTYPSRLSSIRTYQTSIQIETKAETLLRSAEAALEQGDLARAVAFVQEARRLPGWERVPQGIQLWNRLAQLCPRVGLRGARLARTCSGHTDIVTSVSLSADGRLALSGSGCQDGTMRLWEVATGRCLYIFPRLTPEKEDPRKWKPDDTRKWLNDHVTSVNLSADGRLALSGYRDGTMRLWETASGRCLHTFLVRKTSTLNSSRQICVNLSTDGRLALSGDDEGRILLWDVVSKRRLRAFRHVGGKAHLLAVSGVGLSADGRFAISCSLDGATMLWEVTSGRLLENPWPVSQGNVTAVSLSADGRFALTGSGDYFKLSRLSGKTQDTPELSRDWNVRLWGVASGRCLRTFEGHTGTVSSVNLSGDERFVLSGSADMTMRLWEVASGRCLHVFQGHNGAVTQAVLSADGLLALSSSDDGTIHLWELDWELGVP
jgi:WD40 repeat protein